MRANAPTTSRRKEKDTVESMYLLDELLGSTTTSSSTTRECVCPQQDKRERDSTFQVCKGNTRPCVHGGNRWLLAGFLSPPPDQTAYQAGALGVEWDEKAGDTHEGEIKML